MMFEPSRFTTHVGRLFQEACSPLPQCTSTTGPATGANPTPPGYAGMDQSGSTRWVSGPIPHLHSRYPTGPLARISLRSAMPKKITANWPFGGLPPFPLTHRPADHETGHQAPVTHSAYRDPQTESAGVLESREVSA